MKANLVLFSNARQFDDISRLIDAFTTEQLYTRDVRKIVVFFSVALPRSNRSKWEPQQSH